MKTPFTDRDFQMKTSLTDHWASVQLFVSSAQVRRSWCCLRFRSVSAWWHRPQLHFHFIKINWNHNMPHSAIHTLYLTCTFWRTHQRALSQVLTYRKWFQTKGPFGDLRSVTLQEHACSCPLCVNDTRTPVSRVPDFIRALFSLVKAASKVGVSSAQSPVKKRICLLITRNKQRLWEKTNINKKHDLTISSWLN